MAKSIPAAANAPVLDQEVEIAADGAVPPGWFRLRLPFKLPRVALRLPFRLPRIALSKKLLILIAAGVFGVSVVGAAAYAFWPAEPEWPRAPVHKPKKAKKPRAAASAASAPLHAASAASAAQNVAAAASAPEAAADAASASAQVSGEPENPIDRLQRRLTETLGAGGKLEAGGVGELRLTARQPAAEPTPSRRAVPRPHGANTADGHTDPIIDAGPAPATARSARDGAAHSGPLHWSYDGPGDPDAWARLKPEFAKCGSGMRQSPIDIRDGIQVQLDPVQFDYKPSAFRVVDNGHTVQVNVAPGNAIEVMGRRFELQQFHFHRPSEERVDGRQFDMVAHLVHKDAEGRLAVIAVLLERGGAQPIVQTVWNNLPLEKGEEQAAQVTLDLRELLPAERGYFTYMGSLTTPPCSEGVLWMVMKKPVPVSPEQIAIFSRLYPMNARPVQSASGRMIKESN
jgi:carbonic anhydrase